MPPAPGLDFLKQGVLLNEDNLLFFAYERRSEDSLRLPRTETKIPGWGRRWEEAAEGGRGGGGRGRRLDESDLSFQTTWRSGLNPIILQQIKISSKTVRGREERRWERRRGGRGEEVIE